jgi:hypothetical protein
MYENLAARPPTKGYLLGQLTLADMCRDAFGVTQDLFSLICGET